MNYTRIENTIDVPAMQSSHAVMIGGAYRLVQDLAKSGLGLLSMIDFDRIDQTNPARQDLPPEYGRLKVESVAEEIRQRINPETEVRTFALDFCSLMTDEVDDLLGDANLIIDATDFFPVHARTNIVAICLGIPALWIGMYRGARAGEIVYTVPGVTKACYRCICKSRYDAFHRGEAHITSTGGTIFDLRLVDAVAGQIATGILTRGADNRMGRLINQLGDRNLLQVKIDPEYTLGDRDIFGEYLGHHPAQFSFSTIALPNARETDCLDCCHLMHGDEHLGDETDATSHSSFQHA